jgi:hypothetical protein
MSDSLIDRYTKRPATNVVPDDEKAIPEDLGCFGWLRGVRDRALMLELRKADGHILAVGYAWIERIELVPEQGITLHLPGRKVHIKGSGLNNGESARLFDGLIRHRVPWVRVSEHADRLREAEGSVTVESITWDE